MGTWERGFRHMSPVDPSRLFFPQGHPFFAGNQFRPEGAVLTQDAHVRRLLHSSSRLLSCGAEGCCLRTSIPSEAMRCALARPPAVPGGSEQRSVAGLVWSPFLAECHTVLSLFGDLDCLTAKPAVHVDAFLAAHDVHLLHRVN